MFGLIGKKIITLILGLVIFLAVIVLVIAIVATYKPLHYANDYRTDIGWISKNFNSVKGGEYESCYYCWNIFGTTQVSPQSDTVYHGYFNISEEEAEKLTNDYHWVVDESDLPDMGNINLTSYNPYEWYVCKDFESDYFKGMGMRDIRFNKIDTIIFSDELN